MDREIEYFIIETAVEVLVALHEKLRKLISGDDMKAIQRVVISLGHIGVKEASSSQLDVALDLIFSLSRSKVLRLYITQTHVQTYT